MKRRSLKVTLGILLACMIVFSMFDSVPITLHAQESVSEQEEVATEGDAVTDAQQYATGELMTATASYDDAKAYEVLTMVNRERAKQGLNALAMDVDLFNAAKIRAAEIQVSFSHTRPDGTPCFTVSNKAYGENIAAGYRSATAVMTAWMNSSGHRQNILQAGYKSIGIGCYNYNGTLYWVQLFGGAQAAEIAKPSTPVSDTIYNGVDYAAVYNYDYYVTRYPDVKAAFGSDKAAVLRHFANYGMKEGRQAKSSFDVYSYAYKYADLRHVYGNDLKKYYLHYINYGSMEGRAATGTTSMQNYTTVYNGVNYSAVYDGAYYCSQYKDIKQAFGLDDTAMLRHFINYGMNEGRQAKNSFNVYSYAYKYGDLRRVYKNDLKAYYMHYISYGAREGRVATGTTSMQGCTTVYNGVDYSAVYNGTYYSSHNADLRNAFGLDDTAMLRHFINYGMKEGRQAIESFNVKNYKARYADLRRAYGDSLKSYYLHYMNYGKREGRLGK